jgi:glucose-6-phosphate 1-dehydrogenase
MSETGTGADRETNPARSASKAPGPCALVIFGASGDLTKRKLLPALVNLARDGLLPTSFAVVGNSRRPMSDEDFRRKAAADLRDLMHPAPEPALLDALLGRLAYVPGDLNNPATYLALRQRLERCDREQGTGGNYLFYLATAPEHFPEAVRELGRCGLTAEEGGRWRRVVIEKPFGRDLESARALNAELRNFLAERQVYRIDHYLGKETVQNIMVLRFANGIFEPLWNRRYIDHVQVTVAETLGVEGRGGYYDTSGALRDMVPNHLFQLVSLLGMEPPPSLEADAIRDEQVKVLRSIHPLAPADVGRTVVRGQYAAGTVGGKPVPGYRDEPDVRKDSTTETFVAMRLGVDNWRWADVPFYLRTGKRLDRRRTEIVIQFRRAPHLLFRNTAIAACQANQLVLGIQPEEGVSLRFGAKVPGPVVRLGTVTMNFDYAHAFGDRPSTGYERLLFDCMIGDQTLFQRGDMAELAWSVVAPIQKAWQAQGADGIQFYRAGSRGPAAADELLARDGRSWREQPNCD